MARQSAKQRRRRANLCGRTTLDKARGLLSAAAAVVTNDSG